MKISAVFYKENPVLVLDQAGALYVLPEVSEFRQLLQPGFDLNAIALKARQGNPLPPTELRYRPVMLPESRIFCVGLNYKQHAAETGKDIPDFPTIFARFPSGVVAHQEAIVRSSLSDKYDYEGELAVIIGKAARNLTIENTLDCVAGYSIFMDGTYRDYQGKSSQWTLGKNFDASGAIGPCLVTPDELPPGGWGIPIETRVNGQTLQRSSTDQMIFDVPTILATISACTQLLPGDVIAMGTPEGVGVARKPPVYLQVGDKVEVSIQGIGTLSNAVIADRS